MKTKLGTFCDNLIEAGWLAAVIVAPLFFNVYSSRVFEPDKITLVRSIALVMALAWGIKALEQGASLRVRAALRGQPKKTAAAGLVARPVAGIPASLSQVPALLTRSLRSLGTTPLARPALLVTGVYILSTFLAVNPRFSFWGSYHRLQGTYALLSYLVIFFSILYGLRTREQLDRLFSAVLLTSLPIALYALAQKFGFDPLPWSADVTGEPKANMGNSIFLAAYLILIVPLALGRLLETGIERRTTNHPQPMPHDQRSAPRERRSSFVFRPSSNGMGHRWLQVVGYTLLLLILLITILFAGSRGPLMGLMGGGAVFILLAILVFGSRRLMFGALGLGFILFIFLVLLNLPNTPLAPVRELPYVGMLGRLAEAGPGSTIQVRLLIWEEAAELVQAHPGRALIGYGPESLIGAGMRFYQPELAYAEQRGALPDRSHNETFDVLATTGLLGLAAWMGIVISLLYYVLKWLGLIRNSEQRLVFLSLLSMQMVLGAVVPRILAGTFLFLAIGLPLGVVAGVVMYLLVYTLFYYEPPTQIPTAYAILLIALGSAVVAHFLEINFGIAIAATRTYFWTYAALIAVVGRWLVTPPADDMLAETGAAGQAASAKPVPAADTGLSRRRPEPFASGSREGSKGSGQAHPAGSSHSSDHPSPHKGRRRGRLALRGADAGGRHLVSGSLLVTMILITLAYEFVTPQLDLRAHHYVVVWLFGAPWLAGAALALPGRWGESARGRRWAGLLLRLLVYALLTLGPVVLYAPIHQKLLQATDTIPNALVFYYAALGLTLFGLAAGLLVAAPLPPAVWRLRRGWVYPLLAAAVGGLIFATNLSVVRADTYYKQGQHFDGNQWDEAIARYRRAIDTGPTEDYYYLYLGRAYMEQAKATDDHAQKMALMEQARDTFERAVVLNPLNIDHLSNLARFFRTWAGMTDEAELRAERLDQAVEGYLRAMEVSPSQPHLYNELANLYRYDKQDPEQAIEFLKQSLRVDPKYDETYLHLGGLFLELGQEDEAKRREYFQQAIEVYRALTQLPAYYTRSRDNLFVAWDHLGYLHAQLGRTDEAIEANLRALELDPNSHNNHKNLALLYQEQGRMDEAIAEAQQALDLAPDDQKDNLAAYLAQLKGEPAPVPVSGLSEADRRLLQTYLEQGEIYLDQGNLDRAAEAYQQALELNPNLPGAHSYLGLIYAQQGKVEEAIRENLIVLEYNPDDYDSHKNLAILYQQQGRLDMAIQEAEVALKLAPEDQKPAMQQFVDQLKQQIN